MSRKSRTTSSGVERLLEQRRLFQDWLAKLDGGAAETMPSHVVEKVRNDYRTRLTNVMTELTQHDDSIRQTLAEAQSRHEAMETEQQAAKDELAEVRLRKQVGELDDASFKEINGRLKGSIDGLSKELAASLSDIERYEEILELIASEAPEEPEAESEPAPEPAAPTEASARPAPAAVTETAAAAPVRETGEELGKVASQMDALDEMAFIRSVTGVLPPVRRPSRVLGKEEVAPEPLAPAPSARENQPAASGFAEPSAEKKVAMEEPEERPAASVELRASKVSAGARRRSEDARSAQAEGKALVCGECGAPNLPTEWYCEKCGAELSAF